MVSHFSHLALGWNVIHSFRFQIGCVLLHVSSHGTLILPIQARVLAWDDGNGAKQDGA